MAVKKKAGGKDSGGGDSAWNRAAGKAKKQWEKSRKVEDGFGENLKYGEMEDGDYEARLVVARCGVTKKGKGDIFFSAQFAILDGEYEGKKLDVFHTLKDQRNSDQMARTFKRLGYEIENLEPNDIKEIVADLTKTPPDVMLRIANKSENAQGEAYDEPRAFVNVQRVLGDEGSEAEAPAKSSPKGGGKKKTAKKK